MAKVPKKRKVTPDAAPVPSGPDGKPHPNSKFASKPDLLSAAMKHWGVSRAEALGIERMRLDLEGMGVPRDRLDAMFRDPQWVKSSYADKMQPLTQLRADVEPPAPAPAPKPPQAAAATPSAPDAATVERMAKIAAVRAEFPNMSKKTFAAWEAGQNPETLEATYAGLSRNKSAAETNVPADPAKRPPSGEANNLPEPRIGRDGKPVAMVPMDESVVLPNRTPVTQADVIGVGGDGSLPETRVGELPAAVTPTPPLRDVMPGLTPAPGGKRGMSFEPATRDKMWAAYSSGSVEIDGKKDRILAAAKKKGIAADDRAAFDGFLDTVQTKTKPKAGAPGDVQMPAGVELQMADPGTAPAPQTRTETFVGADGRRPLTEGGAAKPTPEPETQAEPTPQPPPSRAKKPWSSDPESPFYNVEKPWFVSAAQGTRRGLVAGAKYAGKTWPGLAGVGLTGAGTVALIRYLRGTGQPQQAGQAGQPGQPMPPTPSMPTDMPTYSPMDQFNVDGIRAALERKRPTDMPVQRGGQ